MGRRARSKAYRGEGHWWTRRRGNDSARFSRLQRRRVAGGTNRAGEPRRDSPTLRGSGDRIAASSDGRSASGTLGSACSGWIFCPSRQTGETRLARHLLCVIRHTAEGDFLREEPGHQTSLSSKWEGGLVKRVNTAVDRRPNAARTIAATIINDPPSNGVLGQHGPKPDPSASTRAPRPTLKEGTPYFAKVFGVILVRGSLPSTHWFINVGQGPSR